MFAGDGDFSHLLLNKVVGLYPPLTAALFQCHPVINIRIKHILQCPLQITLRAPDCA